MLRCIAIWICMFSAMASAAECVDDKDQCSQGMGCGAGMESLCTNNDIAACCPVRCGVCVPDATELQNGECVDDKDDCTAGTGCAAIADLCDNNEIKECCPVTCEVCVPDATEPPTEPQNGECVDEPQGCMGDATCEVAKNSNYCQYTEVKKCCALTCGYCEPPSEPLAEPPTAATCACDALEKEKEELEAQIACVEPKKWDDVTKTCETVTACVYNDHGARSKGKLTLDQIVRVDGRKKTKADSVEKCHDLCKEAPGADVFTYKNSQWCICKSAGKDFEFIPKDGRDSGYLVDTFSSTSCKVDSE